MLSFLHRVNMMSRHTELQCLETAPWQQCCVPFPLFHPLRSRLLRHLLYAWCSCIIMLVVLAVSLLPAQAASRYRVVGPPTVSAAFINRVLAVYHSPAMGKGQTLFDDGVSYGIDPVFALAFFFHESSLGHVGIARVTRSLGNIRTPVTSDCRCRAYQGFRLYNTWEDGFVDWYRLILHVYVRQLGRVTVDQIIPVYAPSRDHNNVNGYIAAVKRAVDRWRNGWVVV